MSDQSLLEFPCNFPIKIMGKNCDEFEMEVTRIIRQHVANLDETAIRQRASGKGNYLAITVTIEAQSQAQLDDLYRALTACKLTKMVL